MLPKAKITDNNTRLVAATVELFFFGIVSVELHTAPSELPPGGPWELMSQAVQALSLERSASNAAISKPAGGTMSGESRA